MRKLRRVLSVGVFILGGLAKSGGALVLSNGEYQDLSSSDDVQGQVHALASNLSESYYYYDAPKKHATAHLRTRSEIDTEKKGAPMDPVKWYKNTLMKHLPETVGTPQDPEWKARKGHKSSHNLDYSGFASGDGRIESKKGKGKKGKRKSKKNGKGKTMKSKRSSKSSKTAPTSSLGPSSPPSLVQPTQAPIHSPSLNPLAEPTIAPVKAPTRSPTKIPTVRPTNAPTTSVDTPTAVPTIATPVATTPPLSGAPTRSPTATPTASPTNDSGNIPTIVPRTLDPTTLPIFATPVPTNPPLSGAPTRSPTATPTATPTIDAGSTPTIVAITLTPTTLPTIATPVPTTTPTPPLSSAPTRPPPTASPTVSPSNVPVISGTPVPTTPFRLDYTSVPNPTTDDFAAARAITLDYLDGFLKEQFSLSIEFQYAGLNGKVTATALVGSATWTADFSVDAVFSTDAMSVPSQNEIDLLIDSAFSQPFVLDLLMSLRQDLMSSNPFSMVSTILYNPI